MHIIETDILVVGSGVSGLMAAREALSAGARTHVISLGGGASGWLQGVNVAADRSFDNLDLHVRDILREGRGINDADLVRQTANAAVDAFQQLEEEGVAFANDGNRYLQRHASGTTRPLCCYVRDIMWGPRALTVLRRAVGRMGGTFWRLRAVRILEEDGEAIGIVAVDSMHGEPHIFACSALVLATGGAGKLYPSSTYPSDVVGTSYAMAAHAGAKLADMEFVQFEPLVGLNPNVIKGYVFPTTLLADGATLRDRAGESLLPGRDGQDHAGIAKEELVRCMVLAQRENRTLQTGGVWFDARRVNQDVLRRYAWLTRVCNAHGVDLEREQVEVWPSAHTELGGIVVDLDRESNISGLFAVGEAATGIHGAGRLAGGSGTDVLASGLVGGRAATKRAAATSSRSATSILQAAERLFDLEAASEPTRALADVLAEVGRLLSSAAGVDRNHEDLWQVHQRLESLHDEYVSAEKSSPSAPCLMLSDRLLIARMIVVSAMARRETRGAHIRSDYPHEDPRFARSLLSSV